VKSAERLVLTVLRKCKSLAQSACRAPAQTGVSAADFTGSRHRRAAESTAGWSDRELWAPSDGSFLFYGLHAFKAQGAEVWAHASVKAYLESEAPALRLKERRTSLARWVDETARIVQPDVWVAGDT